MLNYEGKGYITKKGYHRVFVGGRTGRLRFVHDLVWEHHNGPIPDGFVVHHLNEAKADNRLENLALVSFLWHKRHHSPYFREVDDGWEHQCRVCKAWKPATEQHWYFHKQRGWLMYGQCRPCRVRVVVERKRERRRLVTGK